MPVSPPPAILERFDRLSQIERVEALPAPIASGAFLRPDGTPQPPGTWRLAEPGAPWNATDVVPPGDPLPSRRLVLAACDRTLCVLSYELGGIARTDHLAAFALAGGHWKIVWTAQGSKPVATMTALRSVLAGAPSSYSDAAPYRENF